MSKLTIEKGVTIPTIYREGVTDYSATIDEMEAGDSFVIPAESRNTAISIFRRKKIKCVSRKEEGRNGYVRVWRV